MSEDAFTTSEPIPPVYEYAIDTSSGDCSNGKSQDIIFIKEDVPILEYESAHSQDAIVSEDYGYRRSELDVSEQQAPYDAVSQETLHQLMSMNDQFGA